MINSQSITPQPRFSQEVAQAIAAEANRAINSLQFAIPADRTAVESVLESLKAVAETAAPELTAQLHLRLVAVRNRIPAHQIRA